MLVHFLSTPNNIRFGQSPAIKALNLPKRTTQAAMVRDGIVECFWDASSCVVDSSGKVLNEEGANLDFPIIARSAIKPLHAAALYEFIQQKDPEQLKHFTPNDWAVISASHSGAKEHIQQVESLLKRFNLPFKNLVCGEMDPTETKEKKRITTTKQAFNNTSSYLLWSSHRAFLAIKI